MNFFDMDEDPEQLEIEKEAWCADETTRTMIELASAHNWTKSNALELIEDVFRAKRIKVTFIQTHNLEIWIPEEEFEEIMMMTDPKEQENALQTHQMYSSHMKGEEECRTELIRIEEIQ